MFNNLHVPIKTMHCAWSLYILQVNNGEIEVCPDFLSRIRKVPPSLKKSTSNNKHIEQHCNKLKYNYRHLSTCVVFNALDISMQY